jgi:hypothetical protein
MSIICINTEVYVDIGNRDAEDVCSSFSRGAESALAHFPDGEILQVEVDNYNKLSKTESIGMGFEE